mmetsp:Transcript_3640/g.5323  ORF Transcript_3640/g.5323 Transcript_3640/m.5323 type:complete len:201 (+) Transcript_3640:380-982(+)
MVRTRYSTPMKNGRNWREMSRDQQTPCTPAPMKTHSLLSMRPLSMSAKTASPRLCVVKRSCCKNDGRILGINTPHKWRFITVPTPKLNPVATNHHRRRRRHHHHKQRNSQVTSIHTVDRVVQMEWAGFQQVTWYVRSMSKSRLLQSWRLRRRWNGGLRMAFVMCRDKFVRRSVNYSCPLLTPRTIATLPTQCKKNSTAKM